MCLLLFVSLVLAHIYPISTDGIWLHLIHSSLWWRAVITLLKMGTIVMLPCCSQVDTPQTPRLSLEKHSLFPANLTANKLQSQPLPMMPDGCLVHHRWSQHCWLEGFGQVWTHGIDRPAGINWNFNSNRPPVCSWWGMLQVWMCVWMRCNYLHDRRLPHYLSIF